MNRKERRAHQKKPASPAAPRFNMDVAFETFEIEGLGEVLLPAPGGVYDDRDLAVAYAVVRGNARHIAPLLEAEASRAGESLISIHRVEGRAMCMLTSRDAKAAAALQSRAPLARLAFEAIIRPTPGQHVWGVVDALQEGNVIPILLPRRPRLDRRVSP